MERISLRRLAGNIRERGDEHECKTRREPRERRGKRERKKKESVEVVEETRSDTSHKLGSMSRHVFVLPLSFLRTTVPSLFCSFFYYYYSHLFYLYYPSDAPCGSALTASLTNEFPHSLSRCSNYHWTTTGLVQLVLADLSLRLDEVSPCGNLMMRSRRRGSHGNAARR